MSADGKTRLAGVGLCLLGLFLGWIGLIEPILKEAEGVREVSVYGVGSFLVGPLIVFGLVLIALGARTDAVLRNAEAKRITTLGNVVFGICCLAGLATGLGARFMLQSMGYQA